MEGGNHAVSSFWGEVRSSDSECVRSVGKVCMTTELRPMFSVCVRGGGHLEGRFPCAPP
jgi:hypothetical protein